MNGLWEYQRRRLQLGDTLRAALYVARACGDTQAERRIRDLLARLAEDRFRLAVVGQFSRGKSTLMNALLGAPYLPTGTEPVTSVVTTVRYGSRPRAWYRRRGSDTPIAGDMSQMARLVARSSTERAELQITSVDVEVPAELLRLGIAFIDTPGVGAQVRASTATTRRLLPEADAVIYVTGFGQPLADAETTLLAEAAEHAGKLFLVVNKLDLLADEKAESVLETMRRRLRDELRLGEPRLFALSALQAQQAKVNGDSALLDRSGLPVFEQALVEFLTGEKASLFLRTTAERAARLVAQLRRDLALGRLDLDGGPDPQSVATEFEARMTDLRARHSDLGEVIERRIDAELPGLLSAGAEARRADLRAALEPRVDEAVASARADTGELGYVRTARDRLEEAGRPAVEAWMSRHAAQTHEALLEVVADAIGALMELARTPAALGAELAGRALPGDRAGLAAWAPEDVPALTVPHVDWSLPPAPLRWKPAGPFARDGEQRRLRRALDAAVDAADQRAVRALEAMARDWVKRLLGQAEREAREGADRFRRHLTTRPEAEDLAALRTLADGLNAMRADLGSWQPHATSSAGSAHPAAAPPAGQCVVCEALETELFDRLRHAQFRLATREADQIAHALSGGFCPLHTWQYAALASPVGISAAYARLAESVAGTLVADPADPASSLPAESHAGRRESCPICTALADRERDAVTDALKTASADRVPLVCMRHLRTMLVSRPAPDIALALRNALTSALRRDAQDMRSFALKREALRGDLVTREESRAYDGALRLLAGPSALARPFFSPHLGEAPS